MPGGEAGRLETGRHTPAAVAAPLDCDTRDAQLLSQKPRGSRKTDTANHTTNNRNNQHFSYPLQQEQAFCRILTEIKESFYALYICCNVDGR